MLRTSFKYSIECEVVCGHFSMAFSGLQLNLPRVYAAVLIFTQLIMSIFFESDFTCFTTWTWAFQILVAILLSFKASWSWGVILFLVPLQCTIVFVAMAISVVLIVDDALVDYLVVENDISRVTIAIGNIYEHYVPLWIWSFYLLHYFSEIVYVLRNHIATRQPDQLLVYVFVTFIMPTTFLSTYIFWMDPNSVYKTSLDMSIGVLCMLIFSCMFLILFGVYAFHKKSK